MGWFDENHPMGQDADDAIDEMLGLNKWYKDPQPASSSAPPKRVERPEAEWDSTKWRRSNFRADDTIPKGKAKTQFLLTDKDLLPLEYRKEMNSAGYNNMKCYRKREVEELSWAKHGGPNGLKAAKQEKGTAKATRTPAVPKKAPAKGGKTKSSLSIAVKNDTSGKGKAKA